jgi:hypothetical protein
MYTALDLSLLMLPADALLLALGQLLLVWLLDRHALRHGCVLQRSGHGT